MNRRAFLYLAIATFVLMIAVAVLVTIIDQRDFHNFGDALWWAIVTLGTVGYGDIVPHSAWGRVVGSIVIIFGVTFIAFLTATVTSMFVSAAQERQSASEDEIRAADEDKTQAMIQELSDQVSSMEEKLDQVLRR